MSIKTKDEFIKSLNKLYGYIPYEIKSDFIGLYKPITVKCKECGNEKTYTKAKTLLEVKPSKYDGKLYPVCKICRSKRIKEKTLEKPQNSKDEFIKSLNKLYGYIPYEIKSDFMSLYKPITVKCKECRNIIKLNKAKSLLEPTKSKYDGKIYPPCEKCGRKRISNNAFEKFKIQVNELSNNSNIYTYISDYISKEDNIKIRCNKCNYEFEATPTNILGTLTRSNGKVHYCPRCNKLERKYKELSYAERLKLINPNIIPLEDYINRKTPIMHKCLICNYEWKATPNNRLKGEGCPKCSHIYTKSKAEVELVKYIKSIYKDKVLENNRDVLNSKELDIYLPDIKLAIEINGLYWHNSKRKDKDYHLDKTIECEKLGIRLIHIFSDELDEKMELIKSKLAHIMGCNKNPKIYARNCYIKEIDSKIKNEFLDKNHIQGKDKASIKLGMFYNDVLVSVMTFCKPRKSLGHNKDSEYDYELSRYANNNDYRVIGGFGKLFSYFKENYNFNKIITYADRRWSTFLNDNNIYIKNNFKFLRFSKPNYWYFNRNNKIRIHRYNFRKSKLKTLFPDIYSDDKTEFQIMEEANYLKIYDCGNFVYEYNTERNDSNV